jgi:hypothetical protein
MNKEVRATVVQVVLPAFLVLSFVAAMVLWESSMGIFKFPVLALGCVSALLLAIGLARGRFGSPQPGQRKQIHALAAAAVALGLLALLLQALLQFLSKNSDGY